MNNDIFFISRLFTMLKENFVDAFFRAAKLKCAPEIFTFIFHKFNGEERERNICVYFCV